MNGVKSKMEESDRKEFLRAGYKKSEIDEMKEKRYGTAVVYDEKGSILYNISEIGIIRDEVNTIVKEANERFGYHVLSPFDIRTILQILSDRGLLRKYGEKHE